MHQIAFELQQLDMALLDTYVDRPSFQRQIEDSIQNIEFIGGYIQETEYISQSPFLQDDMDRFLSNVRRAKIKVQRDVPHYCMAGRVSGSYITVITRTFNHNVDRKIEISRESGHRYHCDNCGKQMPKIEGRTAGTTRSTTADY